ncbi:hypothetical protein ACWKSP_04270 [Micromonosporaceae bacterium Da 78-11]
MIPVAADWWTLDDRAAREAAESIADRAHAVLIEVRPHEFAGARRRIALFDVAGQEFAFVPGGQAHLGLDATAWQPTAAQQADFDDEEFVDDDLTIREWVASVTTPPRVVRVPPLLVATTAVEAGRVTVAPDDPRIRQLLATRQAGITLAAGSTHQWSGYGGVRFGSDGAVQEAWLDDVPTYEEETRRLAGLGQRLLTSDEWEWACGAGASTLFRWGDDVPRCGAWEGGDADVHHRRNVFGLQIAHDPYRAERTADRLVLRGGDGGSFACGGSGWFVNWMTLATTYRDDELWAELLQDEEDFEELLARPAIALD